MMSDEELVARSRGGDLDSFNQLVLRWERPIYALAYRVIGREEDARDVAQETFLRAFRALSGFKGQAKFSSWLYRITLNLCRDWIRRERRTPIAQVARGRRPHRARGRGRRARVHRRAGVTQAAGPCRRQGHGAPARRAAHRHHLEGVPRADVSGDCRSARLPVEHGEDAALPGVDRPAAASASKPTRIAPTARGRGTQRRLNPAVRSTN